MDEDGLWRLFERTGLPEAYLAIRAAREASPERLPPGAPTEGPFAVHRR